MAERRVDSTGELEDEGTSPPAPCPPGGPEGGLLGYCCTLPVSQVNGFILHPKSNGKPLVGFEQGGSTIQLGGYIQDMAGCGGAARLCQNGDGDKQTWGVVITRHHGARLTPGFLTVEGGGGRSCTLKQVCRKMEHVADGLGQVGSMELLKCLRWRPSGHGISWSVQKGWVVPVQRTEREKREVLDKP